MLNIVFKKIPVCKNELQTGTRLIELKNIIAKE
jgi:hypothetical protein